jgi:hypothetical protein
MVMRVAARRDRRMQHSDEDTKNRLDRVVAGLDGESTRRLLMVATTLADGSRTGLAMTVYDRGGRCVKNRVPMNKNRAHK